MVAIDVRSTLPVLRGRIPAEPGQHLQPTIRSRFYLLSVLDVVIAILAVKMQHTNKLVCKRLCVMGKTEGSRIEAPVMRLVSGQCKR
jgi:hypothetical protein